MGTLLGEASRPAVRSGDADLCSIAAASQICGLGSEMY